MNSNSVKNSECCRKTLYAQIERAVDPAFEEENIPQIQVNLEGLKIGLNT